LPAASAARISPALAGRIAQRSDESVAVWVFFTDRAGAEHDPSAYTAARLTLTPRALERRVLRGAMPDLVASDLPVHAPYLRALLARGARLRGTSRWLNAASVEIPAALAIELARMPFVERIELVPRGRRIEPVTEPGDAPAAGAPGSTARLEAQAGEREQRASSSPVAALAPGDTAYYGGSFRQLGMMQVPQLHAMGLSGAGVLVCMLDTGFHLTHQAFAGLQVLAARDFIHGDSNVDNEPGQDVAGQNQHGTWTLACVAGSKPGTYSGGAFGATVALGKTEDIASETPAEMDYWQFGAEWADSLGADVISSSLGYSEFDNPAESYTYADMDGRTTVVTLAAAEAARRGITVVTAAGNSGASPWYFIIAPGDADTVITSGAVDSFNVVASFSSHGPTADGRTKPDVTAMGRRVLSVSTSDNVSYVRVSGTSFSTPLTAGLVALLLEANPAWSPLEVREALRETALNQASPDNDIGWGLVRGLAAKAWRPSPTAIETAPGSGPGLALSVGPNPVRAGAGSVVRLAPPAGSSVTVEVFDLAGRRRARLFEGVSTGSLSLRWNGTGEDGARIPDGVYWIRAVVRNSAGPGPGAGPGEGWGSRAVRVALIR